MLTGGQRMVTKTHSSEIRTPRARRRPDGHISEKLKTSSHGTAPGVLEDHNKSFLDSRNDQRGPKETAIAFVTSGAVDRRHTTTRAGKRAGHSSRWESGPPARPMSPFWRSPSRFIPSSFPAAYLRPLGVVPVAGSKLTAADQDQGGKSENGPLRQIESTT
jgi:hypothetical protein